MSSHRAAFLAAFVPCLAHAAPLDRAALVAEVLAHNPALDAAARAVDAAAARADVPAGADPMVSWELAPLSLATTPGTTVGAEWRLAVGGQPGLERAALRARAAAARDDADGVRLALALAASTLYDDWCVADAALALNEDHQALVARLGLAATAAWTASKAPQSAPLQAEAEHIGLERDHVALAARRDVARRRLAALVHAPDVELVRVDEAPDLAELPAVDPADRPDLAALDDLVAAADLDATAARRGFVPDLTVMSSYSTMWPMPEHRWMAGLAVDVPVQLRARRAAVTGAVAEGAELRARAEHVREDAAAEAETARIGAVAAHDAWALTTDRLLPVARERLDAATIAFQAGGARFDDVIEAARDLLRAELDAVEAQAEFHRERAALDAAVGRVPGGAP